MWHSGPPNISWIWVSPFFPGRYLLRLSCFARFRESMPWPQHLLFVLSKFSVARESFPLTWHILFIQRKLSLSLGTFPLFWENFPWAIAFFFRQRTLSLSRARFPYAPSLFLFPENLLFVRGKVLLCTITLFFLWRTFPLLWACSCYFKTDQLWKRKFDYEWESFTTEEEVLIMNEKVWL